MEPQPGHYACVHRFHTHNRLKRFADLERSVAFFNAEVKKGNPVVVLGPRGAVVRSHGTRKEMEQMHTFYEPFRNWTVDGRGSANNGFGLMQYIPGMNPRVLFDDLHKTMGKFPQLKNVFHAFEWGMLEREDGKWDWKLYDEALCTWADYDLRIMLCLWVWPNTPKWLPKHGIHLVQGDMGPFPDYLAPNYQKIFHRAIRTWIAHLQTLPLKVRTRIRCIQSAEGTWGDEGPQHGQIYDAKYRIKYYGKNRDKERANSYDQLKMATWKLYDKLTSTFDPPLNVLINWGNDLAHAGFLDENIPRAWVKVGTYGHGYQLNHERIFKEAVGNQLNKINPNTDTWRVSRSECDDIGGWFHEAPKWNQYWLGLWFMHLGIDLMGYIQGRHFQQEDLKEGLTFYNSFAGEKVAAKATGAWIALRAGIDIADTERFPEKVYGLARKCNKPELYRRTCLIIDRHFRNYGASQGDYERAFDGNVMAHRRARSMNDAGWEIETGNYKRFITQIDPEKTSIPWWRVGKTDQPYGRFARGFSDDRGKDELGCMMFKVHDDFYASFSEEKNTKLKVRVVYFDKGKSQWSFQCAMKYGLKCIFTVVNEGTERWREATAILLSSDIKFGGDVDFKVIGKGEVLFHMVQILKEGEFDVEASSFQETKKSKTAVPHHRITLSGKS